MNGVKKEEVKRELCKSHSARSDRELYRVCPSKISKKELEDLYFSLLEKNLELKKTVTAQQDQIKVLSTRVQRMTATQKNNVAREKDCCMYTKAMVNEQKESIADLQRANEKMSERIRVLNMRLCSAKQFLRRSPASSASRCAKCSAPLSLKNSSVSVLHPKKVEGVVKSTVSHHSLDKDAILSTRTVETETDEPEKGNTEMLCNENRCRSQMEELKQKIVDLQEELSKTHTEYSARITRLETEVSDLREANERERTERATSDHQLQARGQQADLLAARLRDAEAKYGELSAELSVERRRAAELQARARAADRSAAVARTVHEHLNANLLKDRVPNQQSESAGSPYFSPRWDQSSSPQLGVPESPGQPSEATDKPCTDKDASTEKDDQERVSKLSNDSGYIDESKAVKANNESNEDLKNRIANLQQQMNELIAAMKAGLPNETTPLSKGDDTKLFTGSHDFDSITQTVSDTLKEATVYESDNARDRFERPSAPVADTDNTPGPSEEKSVAHTQPQADVKYSHDSTTQGATHAIRNTYEVVHEDIDTDEAKKDTSPNKDGIPTRSDQTEEGKLLTKHDTHNKLQIPGPLPVDMPSRDSEKSLNKFRKISSSLKPKKTSNDPAIRAREIDKLQSYDEKGEVGTPLLIQDDAVKTKRIGSRETKVRISVDKEAEASPGKPRGHIVSLTEKFVENEEAVPSSDTIIPVIPDKKNEPQDNALELCLQHARVCTCGGARRRDVSVFRTCSGTLRFRTAPANSPAFKRCGCNAVVESKRCSYVDNGESAANKCERATQTSDTLEPTNEFRRRSATYSKGQEYPAPSQSPDNTDCEISTMTDLPSERDDKSPRDLLSPGEEKLTSTYTDSYTPHTTDYGTLSEGELPGAGGAQQLSDGETKVDACSKKQPGQCMEETLAAISEELQVCRGLLQARRPEVQMPSTASTSKDVSLMVDLCPGPLALKKAAGSPRIGDAITPKCIFTLHIGTVVLSDEAVINSRNMSLVLTWQFYDQSVAMTRMNAGRVVLFDFSTEYDVKLTDSFLNYLKHENMQLVISEQGSPNEPFATSELPLRDALLHPNRRADMSLALIAGPALRQAHDALDTSDEVGVLDLWCMLRVEAALLPAISRAIARPSSPVLLPNFPQSPCIQQLIDDDRYNDDLSQDLDMRPSLKPKPDVLDLEIPCSSSKNVSDMKPRKSLTLKQRTELNDVNFPARDRDMLRSVVNQNQSHAGPPIIQPAAIRRSIASQISSPTDQGKQTNQPAPARNSLQRGPVGFKDSQPSNIKTAEEVKRALARNVVHENSPPMSRLLKEEEDVLSQTQSTAGSLRGLVTRRLLPKTTKGSSFYKNDLSLTSIQKKDLSTNTRPRQLSEAESLELSKSVRGQNGSKKSVTIAKYHDSKTENRAIMTVQKLPEYGPAPSVDHNDGDSIEITVMWLALNEECDAMVNPNVQRLYVAYSFLGRGGADLETPVSLPKPKSYVDKCFFQFSKQFQLNDCDLPILGHMGRCRSANRTEHSSKNCVVFTVISEPPEDPLGLDNCEDIGNAYLYLGDLLAFSAGNDSYMEVLPVQSAQPGESVCGVLAVRVNGLDVLRRCTMLSQSEGDLGVLY